MSDKCPFCGADFLMGNDREGVIIYNCESSEVRLIIKRSKKCYERQIANLQERIKELEAEVVGGEP